MYSTPFVENLYLYLGKIKVKLWVAPYNIAIII